MKREDIAWAAGFFDGEGSIIIRGTSTKISIGQKAREPLEHFIAIFKVSKIVLYQTKYKSQDYTFYSIQMHGETALAILRLMLPYLIVKRNKALEALGKRKNIFTKDKKRIQLIFLLHSKGHSFTTIGKMLNISRQRAHKIYSSRPQPLILNNHQSTYLNYFFKL